LKISLAFRSFFALLFKGALSDELVRDLGLVRREERASAPAPPPPVRAADGALQMLSILQRDARLIDFLMEDISPYSDDQVGAAVRGLHDQCRQALAQYVALRPVIDGVEGAYTRTPADTPEAVKFIGNVPASTPPGGTLRHKGWRVAKLDLPAVNTRQDLNILAPAEIEVE
jgi:hypothetical protein